MASITSQRAPLAAAIPPSINFEDVNMTAETSHRRFRPSDSTAEQCVRRV